ncbi:hypothetical protein [Clostridium cellulovorans]|uniref:Uncharacterized protein n=1 Tax=Clostridium cellulovorans (strain ATCC 35296 / DSM 3052 / OCM 3 / 743B) TaxID=573061 RepID=D9SWF5_CLOC7|nr:hypothetical protein [Clostridium cellulovorans]ADL53237.1 hypothetical protein Clocel_3561 [Clostridium cellulovorans 743B]
MLKLQIIDSEDKNVSVCEVETKGTKIKVIAELCIGIDETFNQLKSEDVSKERLLEIVTSSLIKKWEGEKSETQT